MKKLWITGVSLSIFVLGNLGAQEAVTAHRGAGSCWSSSKDGNGIEIFTFNPSTSKCGWLTVFSKPHDTAGSPVVYNGYIKMVNPAKPCKAFYLGSTSAQRSLKFGKDAQIACYICRPDNTNCLPNDPTRVAECFVGTNKIECTKQVDCSLVLNITECYPEGKGVFSQVYNDLQLCDEPDINLINYSGAGSAGNYQAHDNVLSTHPI